MTTQSIQKALRRGALAASLLLLPLCSTRAQWKVGPKVGVNFSKVTKIATNPIYSDDIKTIAGPRFGAVASYDLSQMFAVQAELLYNQTGFKMPVYIGTTNLSQRTYITHRSHYLSLPILFKIYPLGTQDVNLQFGPQLSYLMGRSTKLKDTPELDNWPQHKPDVALVAGLGVDLPGGLFFDARYAWGLTEPMANGEVKGRSLQLSIGYFFSL